MFNLVYETEIAFTVYYVCFFACFGGISWFECVIAYYGDFIEMKNAMALW